MISCHVPMCGGVYSMRPTILFGSLGSFHSAPQWVMNSSTTPARRTANPTTIFWRSFSSNLTLLVDPVTPRFSSLLVFHIWREKNWREQSIGICVSLRFNLCLPAQVCPVVLVCLACLHAGIMCVNRFSNRSRHGCTCMYMQRSGRLQALIAALCAAAATEKFSWRNRHAEMFCTVARQRRT